MGGGGHWIDVLFGMALVLNMVLVPMSILVPVLDPAAGASTLAAAVIGLVRVRPMQRLLALVLIGSGLSALVAAFLLGGRPPVGELLTLNQTLLGMLTAVSFVRLITGDSPVHEPRLTGVAAVWRTATIVQLLGAVINVSAVTLVGDRLRRSGQLHMADALLLSRAYSPGAFWSPFWGASAAALTYASGASTVALLVCGGLLALCAFTVSVALVVPRFGDSLVGYRGYPLSARVLVLPISLAVLVIGFHLVIPTVRLAVVVLLAALLVPVVVLAVTKTRHLPRILGRHVVHGLRPMQG